MYKIVSLDGTKKFVFQRPGSEINTVLNEFYETYGEVARKLEKKSHSQFVKELFSIIVLCEDPTANYNKIEDAKLNYEFHGLEYYFHFSTKRISRTNKLIEAVPELFDTPEYYFTFLNSIKISVRHLLQQIKASNTHSEEINSPKTIAYALKFYKQAYRPSKSDKELIMQFNSEYGSTCNSIKTELSEINREAENSVAHIVNLNNIKLAIKILRDRKSKDIGRQFMKQLSK